MDLQSKAAHPIVSPSSHTRQELEDAYGILNYSGARVRIGRGRFAERIRRLPRCKPFLSLFYVGWSAFLVAYLLMRVLSIWLQVTSGGITKGLDYHLRPFRITTQDVVSFQKGHVIRDSTGATVLDPAVDGLLPILLQPDGTAWIHDQRWSPDDAQTLCDTVDLYSDYRTLYVGVLPDRKTRLQDVVTVLDGFQLARQNGCAHRVRAVLVSP